MSYELDVREAANDSVLIYKQYSEAQAGCEQTSGDCWIQKADAPMSANKRWRVRAMNAEGASAWSEWTRFNVSN